MDKTKQKKSYRYKRKLEKRLVRNLMRKIENNNRIDISNHLEKMRNILYV